MRRRGIDLGTLGHEIVTDSSSNIYIGGYTGKGELDGNTAAGDVDFIVVKYDSTGTKQFTKQVGVASTWVNRWFCYCKRLQWKQSNRV
jgi:hypothetical protein